MVKISTSILSVDESTYIKTFYDLEFARTDYFHIDVMDGKFVENNTSKKMFQYANDIKHISNTPLDVHLMVEDVRSYIEDYIVLEPDIITFHIEAIRNEEEIKNLIKYIKENNIKVGLAVSPKTQIEQVYPFLNEIHMVLIMSVEPGYGGQKLIPETLEKTKRLKEYCEKNTIDIDIEMDGGIYLSNCKSVKEAGVNIIVAGSAILHAEEGYEGAIKELKKN